MNTEHVKRTLILPALRANMGDWNYYICALQMRDAVERIHVAQDIHASQSLRDLLQRKLTNRSSEIKDYLLTQPQRFFNSIVVGAYGGHPTWYEIDIDLSDTDIDELPENLQGIVGILVLQGTETLFAIDGQHRLAGIKEALKENPDLGDEEISVIFVDGVIQEHRFENPNGFVRTRRLFTTLNRYAKPVNKKDIIALDEDDVVAIISRYLVEEYPLFRGDRVSTKGTKSIPKTDKQSITTIIALYQAIELFLQTSKTHWKKFIRTRPTDDEIAALQARCVELCDSLVKHFPPLSSYMTSSLTSNSATDYRHDTGGHLLFRPIGFLVVIRAIRLLIDNHELNTNAAVELVAHNPLLLTDFPWNGLLWDAVNRRMITAQENQDLATKLLYYLSGGNVSRLGTSVDKLTKEYAGFQKTDPTKIEFTRLPELD